MTKDINKLCFLPGSLLPLKDGKYPYISLLKQGLTNLGVTFPTPVPGAPGLTATQIAFGDGSNLMTSSNKLTWDNSTSDLLLKNGSDSMIRMYRTGGGNTRISMYDGDSNELTMETGSGYIFMTQTDLAIANDNDFGNPNLLIEPALGSNEKAISVAGYEGEVLQVNKHGWVGIGTTPAVALDVVGTVNISEVLTLNPIAYASLPASPTMGMIACINDSGGGDWGDIVVSGGATISIIFYNGTDWKIMGK